MASTQAAITVAGLRKAYGSKQVLDGVDLSVGGYVWALWRYNRKSVRA